MERTSKAEREHRETHLPIFANIPEGRSFLSSLPGKPIILANLERWTRINTTTHGGEARSHVDGRIVQFQNWNTAFLLREN